MPPPVGRTTIARRFNAWTKTLAPISPPGGRTGLSRAPPSRTLPLMDLRQLQVDPDIKRAETIPGWAYCDADLYALARERIFAPSWQFVADADAIRTPGQTHPLTLLEGCLDEPLLLTRDADDRAHCLSNVCTHRANLVCEHAGAQKSLRCRYHGRQFALDGRMKHMPEFGEAENFPREADHLPRLPLERWMALLFTSLRPFAGFDEWMRPVTERVGWIDLSAARFAPGRSRDYLVEANWALYVENYLEGFHIPFVHASLADEVDYGSYRTELFRYASLQVGYARGGGHAFTPPAGSADHEQAVAGYYLWLFPNLMLNFYPWGLSINIVKPLRVDRTRVSFLAYVVDESKLDRGAGAELDRVEREDEAIVELVQRGVRSRLYDRGRYSPTREQGTHHFHRLIGEFLTEA